MTTVAEARDLYLAANNYDLASYTDRRFVVQLGFLSIPFRNRGVLHWHDLHHVATGFTAGFIGEAEVSVYELRLTGRPLLVTFLCVASIVLCLPIGPLRLWRAWKRSKGCRGLYQSNENYEKLLSLSVVELRTLLNIPAGGLAS